MRKERRVARYLLVRRPRRSAQNSGLPAVSTEECRCRCLSQNLSLAPSHSLPDSSARKLEILNKAALHCEPVQIFPKHLFSPPIDSGSNHRTLPYLSSLPYSRLEVKTKHIVDNHSQVLHLLTGNHNCYLEEEQRRFALSVSLNATHFVRRVTH